MSHASKKAVKWTQGEAVEGTALAFPVVGIGASAGGLEAITQFLENCPADTDLAFVVITHMDATQKSLLSELLSRVTKMRIFEAEDGMSVEPGTVYTIPPSHDLVFKGGQLSLLTRSASRGIHLPIDTFFRSLASELKERSIGIILSGSGSDGSLGLKEIKEAGGMIMVQSINSAKFDPMPRSAIATKMVDFVLPVEQMPARLLEYTRAFFEHHGGDFTGSFESGNEGGVLDRILERIQGHNGHDFTHYKTTTMTRRIAKRMLARDMTSPEAYADLLTEEPDELDTLCRDLLIGVTRFFRDSKAFTFLGDRTVPGLFEGKQAGDTIRIWSVGCSTGEEAYSLAILVKEYAEKIDSPIEIKLFATDLDPHAIEVARAGRYPITVAQDVPPERLERYFQLEGDCYVLKQEIRKMMVFAEHDILRDPPFYNIDLLSCRNLLIYLKAKVHEPLFSLFYHSLQPGGSLFLGSAESLGQSSEYFETVEKKLKVFKKNETVSVPPSRLQMSGSRFKNPIRRSFQEVGSEKVVQFNELQKVLLDEYVPAAVLVDENLDIIYYSGDTSPYLRNPKGAPTRSLLKQVYPHLCMHLRSAIRKAKKTGQEVFVGNLPPKEGADFAANIRIRFENKEKPTEGGMIIIFEKYQSDLRADKPLESTELMLKRGDLEEELKTTAEELQEALEELDALGEEFQTAYEELMSMNEELQSSNEELETSKEELQSLNEELSSVNSDLIKKISDLELARDDIENLLTSTHFPTIVVNKDLEIRHFTPQSAEIFHIILSDLGRPIQHVVSKLVDGELIGRCKSVLESLKPLKEEVLREDGSCFWMRIHPYITSGKTINGLVITFSDITEIKLAHAELQKHQEALEELVSQKTKELKVSENLLNETSRLAKIGGWELDIESEQLMWTEQTHRIHGLEAEGFPVLDSAIDFYHPEDQPVIEGLVRACIEEGTPYEEELRFTNAKGRNLWVRVMGERRERDGKKYLGGTIADITDRKAAQISLQKSTEELKQAQQIAHVGSWEWDVEKDEIVWSDELYRIMEMDPSEELPNYEGNLKLYHPDERETLDRAVRRAVEEGIPYEIELRMLSRDGTGKMILAKCRIKKNAEGAVTHLYGTVLDITESKTAEQRLKDAHQRLLNVLENTTDGFMEMNKDYIVTYINQVGLDSLKVKESDLLGKNVWEVFPSPESDQFQKHYDQAFTEKKEKTFVEFYEPLKEWIEVHVCPNQDTFSTYFRMVTERKQHQIELEKAKVLAESANKAKSEFLANMSHEIRTPLNGIQGNLQLLEMSHLNAEQNECIEMAMNSSDSLITIIGDILDFSKIEAGKVVVAQRVFTIQSLMDSLKSSLSAVAKNKGLQLGFEIDSDVPPDVVGDIGRTRQVLFNLIGNAIKFTDHGGVDIGVTVLEKIDSPHMRLGFSIVDTGIGIPEDSIPRLFEPFTQMDTSPSRSYQGTGLGLSIVERLVKLMGGSVGVHSTVGKGTTVHFDIVVGVPTKDEPEKEGLVAAEAVQESEEKKSFNILVVEDDRNNSIMLAKILEKMNHVVRTAIDGKEALKCIKQDTFDLIFMDIQMPKMDGFKSTQTIRTDPEFKHVAKIPIVAVTAHVLAGYRERCLEAGMNDYLSKPIKIEELRQMISKYL